MPQLEKNKISMAGSAVVVTCQNRSQKTAAAPMLCQTDVFGAVADADI